MKYLKYFLISLLLAMTAYFLMDYLITYPDCNGGIECYGMQLTPQAMLFWLVAYITPVFVLLCTVMATINHFLKQKINIKKYFLGLMILLGIFVGGMIKQLF